MANKRMGGSSVDANVLGVRFFDGTYQTSAGTLANKQQTLRVSYAITPTDQNNYYANVPVVFATPFADTNYTVAATMAIDYSQYPAFTPNMAVAQGYTVVDSNGMLQQVTTAGTTGPTVPVWSAGPAYSGTTTSGTAVFTIFTIGDFAFLDGVKSKTASGFVTEVGTYDVTANFPMTITIDVIAVHD